MRKLLVTLFVLLVFIVIAGVGVLYYIKPDQSLDLTYEKVPLKDRAIDMARRMSPELILTSEDLNNLAIKSLANNPQVEENVQVTGANFELEGELLVADLNIIWNNRVAAGLELTYRLAWVNPNVIATVEKARLKGVTLPASMFSDRIIPIADDLPKWLKIKDVEWGNGQITILFQKPSLQDLQQLIG